MTLKDRATGEVIRLNNFVEVAFDNNLIGEQIWCEKSPSKYWDNVLMREKLYADLSNQWNH